MPLDPVLKAFLDQIAATGGPKTHEMQPSEAREAFAGLMQLAGPKNVPIGKVTNISIPAEYGDIAARSYEAVAAGREPLPTLVFFHGGGWVIGNVDTHDGLCRMLANESQCRVISVDYRLSPEAKFPAAVDDALAAVLWIEENAAELGVDANRIAVGGDSAGGGLAAALLLALRDRGGVLPAAAVLLSAWTDLTAEGESYATRSDADPIHQRAMILATARQYLGPQGDASNPLASPLFGGLAGLPPLLLQVGDRETVLDDSTRFAAKARAAGVRADLEVYDNMIHVFQQFADEIPEARLAIAAIGRFLVEVWDEFPASVRPC